MDATHLGIAGDGPLRPSLEQAAVQLGVHERVHFLGEVAPSRMGDVFASADVFAFPSVTETFGLAVVEAAMSGVPVVCSDLPVLREVLSTPVGEAALFAPSTDAVAFGQAIQRLLSQPDVLKGMVKPQDELRKRYSAERMVTEYEALLQQLRSHPNHS